MKRLMLLLFLLLLPSVAAIDLLNPADQSATAVSTITFDYYVSMQEMTGCTLLINNQPFADPDAQSGTMNNVQIQNLPSGQYAWNVSCTNGTTEQSPTRTFTIDNQTPSIAIFTPSIGLTAKVIPVDFIPNDETAVTLSCSIAWNNQTLETVQVTRGTHYIKNYTSTPGNGTLAITCTDTAGNTQTQSRSMILQPDFSLKLYMSQKEYGLGETPQLTIDTIPGANVTIDICPDQPGFVQCSTALLTNTFPQTISLPYMNKTGPYIVDGRASYAGQTKANRTNYTLINTINLVINTNLEPRINRTFNMTAVAAGGVGPYRYVWQLANGSRLEGQTMGIAHNAAGNITHLITAYDAANNSRIVNFTYSIYPSANIIIKVFDNQTKLPIKNAGLDFTNARTNDEQSVFTLEDGRAYIDVEHGRYRIFISAQGYEYTIADQVIVQDEIYEIGLRKSLVKEPVVTITNPAVDAVVTSPVAIQYGVTHTKPVTCSLQMGDPFKENGTSQVTNSGEFVRELPIGGHRVRISCSDGQYTGLSQIVTFTVTEPQAIVAGPTSLDLELQRSITDLDAYINALEAYGPKEKEAIAALGFDRQLRAAKKTLQQYARDVNDLQFRDDLDEAAKEAQRKRVKESLDKTLAATPVLLEVTDSKTYVKYLKEPDIAEVAKELGSAGLGSEKAIASQIAADQQKFTISTKLVQVEYSFMNGEKKTITVVTRSFTYAPGLAPEYQVYEIVPKEIAKSAKELQLITKGEVVKDDPIIKYGQEPSITYIIPKRVDFTRLEDTKTVLARKYAEQNLITGFAIFSGGDIKGVALPLILLIVFIGLAYAAYYFDLGKQVKYLIYRTGKNEQMHYVQVLIGDALDQLDTNNYDKAEMIYREVRMTYDALPDFGKNELYEDVMDLVHRMDSFYFNMIMIEIDGNIKAGDLHAAIEGYEKLTKIYERLDVERQQQLVQTVTGMAQRLGVTA